MNDKISTVVFDLGGVLIDWNPRHLYRRMFDDEERMEWFLTHICTPEWNTRQDAGRSFEDATQELLERHPEHADLIRAYYGRWDEMLAGPIEGSVEILREIKESPYRLYALTNWSAEAFPTARAMYDFLDWFEGIVVSGEIGIVKPDSEIFEHLATVFDLRPSESLFIDDVAANVEAARDAGFDALLFENPDQLRSDLEDLGIIAERSPRQPTERRMT